jgi:hypothetical protein
MKIIIHCTEDQACAVRDALHNYYHDALPLKTERAIFLRNSCRIIADYLKEGIARDMRLITVWLIK